MSVAVDLTEDEKAEAERIVADLYDRGYRWRDRFSELERGTRVRHVGHQWPKAFTAGTGAIVAITERPDSAWSVSWGVPDVEMVVAFDEPALPGMSRLSTLAQYHVQAVP